MSRIASTSLMTRLPADVAGRATDPGGMKPHDERPDDGHEVQGAEPLQEVDPHTAFMRAQYARIAGTGLSLLDELMADEPAEAAPKAPPSKEDGAAPSAASSGASAPPRS